MLRRNPSYNKDRKSSQVSGFRVPYQATDRFTPMEQQINRTAVCRMTCRFYVGRFQTELTVNSGSQNTVRGGAYTSNGPSNDLILATRPLAHPHVKKKEFIIKSNFNSHKHQYYLKMLIR